MRVLGERQGMLAVDVGGGVAVLLDGDRCSPPLGLQQIGTLGPWTPTRHDPWAVTQRLRKARTVPVEVLLGVRGNYPGAMYPGERDTRANRVMTPGMKVKARDGSFKGKVVGPVANNPDLLRVQKGVAADGSPDESNMWRSDLELDNEDEATETGPEDEMAEATAGDVKPGDRILDPYGGGDQTVHEVDRVTDGRGNTKTVVTKTGRQMPLGHASHAVTVVKAKALSYTPEQAVEFKALLDGLTLDLASTSGDDGSASEHPFTHCMEVIIPAMEKQGKAPDDPKAFCGWYRAQHGGQ